MIIRDCKHLIGLQHFQTKQVYLNCVKMKC